ncbi:hypothetical protein BFO_0780 [Tannerella forsythia 92A2]|uniref:Uncharacterized protein n=2 Tax=Tannerella forsythia TaxID=28112 RepID=G8UNG7_TANFA|nr:hypothetical protein BFO_0780 [Tannerella forsythia 92A2]
MNHFAAILFMLKIDCIHLIRKDSFLSNTNIDSKTERKDFSKNQRVHIKSLNYFYNI